MEPATLSITIHQRATFRRFFKLPFDCTGHQVVAQVWSDKRRRKIIDFDVEWSDQAEGEFFLVADFEQTTLMTKDGQWDLMVIYPNEERQYWIEGAAILDPGTSEPE